MHNKSSLRLTICALLLALIAAAPLWGPGMVNTRGGGDSPFLLQRTLDMAENLRHGIFPARWMAHAAYDLGCPFFNHYAALPYYLSGGLTAAGLSPLLAIQATQTLGFVLAALAMALWARRLYRNQAAVLLATVAYTYAPFHLVNVYVRGDSLSEFYAFVWYPLILWTLDRLAEKPARGRVAAAALAYGALILTHNVSALIFSPFALLYAFVARSGDRPQRLFTEQTSNAKHQIPAWGTLLAPFVLGILLTAWFWAPAIGELGYGQLGPEFTAGYFHYSNHFRGLDLVQPALLFDYSVAGNVSEAGPFAMGLVQAALALVGAGVLVKSQKSKVKGQKSKVKSHATRNTHYVFLLLGLLVSTFMITPLSAPLWEHLPLLATTQFPWRFLSVQALFTAAVTGVLGTVLQQKKSKGKRQESKVESRKSKVKRQTANVPRHTPPYVLRFTLYVLLLVSLCAATLLSLHPDRLLITAEDVTWDNLLLYESFTGNIGTTIRYEYLPRDVAPRLYISEAVVDGVDAARPIAGGDVELTAELLERTPIRQTWRVTLGHASAVTFPLNWWPGWQADVDGAPVEASPMPGSGRLTVNLAGGEHTVTLRLRNTPLRTAANVVSALTLLAGLGLLLAPSLWLGQRPATASAHSPFTHLSFFHLPSAHSPFTIHLFVISSFVILSFVICSFVISSSSSPTGNATFFDFIQMPYPHAGPVDFGLARLEDAGPLPAVVTPGETLDISMTWKLYTERPLTATLRLVSPAEPRHNVPYALAETDLRLPPGTTRDDSAVVSQSSQATLALPPDLSRGLYLLELRLYDRYGEIHAHTKHGAGMGVLYIGALRVRRGPSLPPDAPVLAQLGDGDLTLHAVAAEQPDPVTLRARMTWSTPGTPRNWSLSLRLLDVTGRQIVSRDLQPGYGYLPTTLWHPGEQVTDFPVLPLPEGLAPGEYTLKVITYLKATMESGGEIDVPLTLTQTTLYDTQNTSCELTRRGADILCRGEDMNLLGLELPEEIQEGDGLDFYAQWNATQTPRSDFAARWDVLTPDGDTVASTEGELAPGSHTSTWPRFTWVRAPVHLDLPPVLPDGPYHLRLTLLAEGEPYATCVLSRELPVTQRERLFTAPPLAHPQAADFGDVLRLLGYDLLEEQATLSVSLWWQAGEAPGQDYKRFVHLYDAATGAMAVQDDAMPRDWTYPTSLWAAGEVVSETITLDVRAVPPGTYRLAVGWYDPDTGVRLAAADSTGERSLNDRFTLTDVIFP